MKEFDLQKIKKHLSFWKCGGVDINYHCGWKLMISIFLVLNILVILFGIYFYFQIERGSFFVVDSGLDDSSRFSNIKKVDIIDLVSMFASKERDFERLEKNKNINIVDPSL